MNVPYEIKSILYGTVRYRNAKKWYLLRILVVILPLIWREQFTVLYRILLFVWVDFRNFSFSYDKYEIYYRMVPVLEYL